MIHWADMNYVVDITMMKSVDSYWVNRGYIMLDKNKEKLKRKKERETFVGFRPSSIDHAKIYTRKRKHKKDWADA